MTEQRKGYENFVYQNGVYDLGTKGDMRRNERNLMWNLDVNFLSEFMSAPLRLSLTD